MGNGRPAATLAFLVLLWRRCVHAAAAWAIGKPASTPLFYKDFIILDASTVHIFYQRKIYVAFLASFQLSDGSCITWLTMQVPRCGVLAAGGGWNYDSRCGMMTANRRGNCGETARRAGNCAAICNLSGVFLYSVSFYHRTCKKDRLLCCLSAPVLGGTQHHVMAIRDGGDANSSHWFLVRAFSNLPEVMVTSLAAFCFISASRVFELFAKRWLCRAATAVSAHAAERAASRTLRIKRTSSG